MPHAQCSVCNHPDRSSIEAALKSGVSIRKVAARFAVSSGSIDRHNHHDEHQQKRENIDEIKRIKKEIRKLHHAETAARKRRDNDAALAISRELRNWHILLQKARLALVGATSANNEQLSPAEALRLAQAVIEAELHSPDVIAWVEQLYSRIRHVVVPATPASEIQDE